MSYHIVWRYTVKPGHARDFERAYAADGRWAGFFRTGDGYVGTELIALEPGRVYMTIDTWGSAAEYERFAAERADEYAAIDREFEPWTEREERLGAGETVG